MADRQNPSPGPEHSQALVNPAFADDDQSPQANLLRGNRCAESRQFDAALACYDTAIAVEPAFALAHFNRGVVLKALNQPEAALASYDRAIAITPAFAAAHFNRGVVLNELTRTDAALASYDQTIRIQADHAGAYCNRGILLEQLGQLEAAIDSFNRAIEMNPAMSEACFNRGNVLRKLQRFDAALESYDQAIALDAGRAGAHYNRGNLLKELRQFDSALASYNQAIAIDANYVEAYANRGNLFLEARDYESAIASYDEAFVRNPAFHFLAGQRRHARMHICDWSHFDEDIADLAVCIEADEAASPPQHLMSVSGSARLHRKAAEVWVRERFPVDPSLPEIPRWAPHEKIRIGYFSADFRQHPVSILAVELIEIHDRSRFEIIAFGFGPPVDDPMRTRLARTFDRFLDLSHRSDREIALLARELQIDVAVDLGGFTQHSRPGIFALRAAPVQVNFLGYPGTLGAPYMDYLLADPTLIPEPSRPHYREKILYLPHSVLPHDSRQPIAQSGLTRRQAGLPALGFVFCCFNAVAKITPDTFSAWMRILTQVPGSVLWLSSPHPTAQHNLRREAANRGVLAERLIFAPRLASLPEHLARHRLADLFLDTLPYNAHTTASDALWAGLPVLTQIGETYAGRVAASLLTAIGLPELITSTHEQYEALAISLATHPQRLTHLTARLAQNRLTTPLFDAHRYTQHLQAAYESIHARYRAGLPPEDIWVQPSLARDAS